MAVSLRSECKIAVSSLDSEERKPPSLKRQKVLEEDSYVEAVEEIITRDYFPDLPKMKLDKEYLEALENNDVERLRQVQLQQSRVVQATPSVQSELSNEDSEACMIAGLDQGNAEVIKGGDVDSKLNVDVSNVKLDAFLAANTSEDNASFEMIMEDARKKHREKYSWLFDKQNELKDRQEEMLSLHGPDDDASGETEYKALSLDSWTYKPKNTLMYVPEGTEFSAKELIEKSGKKRQEIAHRNTRFKVNPFDSDASKSMMLTAAKEHAVARKALGKIGVDGKVQEFSDSPQVNGYGFVATPSPAPGVDSSPFMTWGEIEGTPLRLDATPHRGNSTPGPSFKIPEAPRREKLGHALAEKVGKQYREKKQKAAARAVAAVGRSPGRLTTDMQGTLSPAAQKLLKSSIRLNTDKALRNSYSPSPKLRTPGSSTPGSRATPKSARMSTPSAEQPQIAPSLTDNLLQLPKA